MQNAVMEYAVLAVDIVRRRWLQFLIPVLLAVALGGVLAKLAPKIYTTKSLILLQSANRSSNVSGPQSSLARDAVLQQISAIDAWIKSDQVLRTLLPKLTDGRQLQGDELVAQIRVLRLSLSMELIGNSALEIKLEGREAQGLALKLEVIIERIMDGLTGPEQSILNASQFIGIRRSEELQIAERAVDREILAIGYNDTSLIKGRLKQISEIQARPNGRGGDDNVALLQAARLSISRDLAAVIKLEALYAHYLDASARNNRPRTAARSSGNYFGIFDTPENLLLVGRPQDPIYGENSARKGIMALILLSVMCTGGLLLVLELLSGRARLRSEFETLTGAPVVARFQKL